MKRALLLAAILAAMVVSPVQAHRISTSQAESIWYGTFNWHCGNGDTWFCGTRNAGLNCWPTANAPHRNSCRYEFSEHRFAGSNRWCVIWGDLLHTDVYYWREDC